MKLTETLMDRICAMAHHTRPIRIALRPLFDQAAVDILEFLHSTVQCFESRYFERSEREMCQPDPPPMDDDVPFRQSTPITGTTSVTIVPSHLLTPAARSRAITERAKQTIKSGEPTQRRRDLIRLLDEPRAG